MKFISFMYTHLIYVIVISSPSRIHREIHAHEPFTPLQRAQRTAENLKTSLSMAHLFDSFAKHYLTHPDTTTSEEPISLFALPTSQPSIVYKKGTLVHTKGCVSHVWGGIDMIND